MKKLLLFVCAIALLFTACGGGGSDGDDGIDTTYNTYPGNSVWANYGFPTAPLQPNGVYSIGVEDDGMMTLLWNDVDSSDYNAYQSELESKLPFGFTGPIPYPVNNLGLSNLQAEGVFYTYNNQGTPYLAIVMHALRPFYYQGMFLDADDAFLVLGEY